MCARTGESGSCSLCLALASEFDDGYYNAGAGQRLSRLIEAYVLVGFESQNNHGSSN